MSEAKSRFLCLNTSAVLFPYKGVQVVFSIRLWLLLLLSSHLSCSTGADGLDSAITLLPSVRPPTPVRPIGFTTWIQSQLTAAPMKDVQYAGTILQLSESVQITSLVFAGDQRTRLPVGLAGISGPDTGSAEQQPWLDFTSYAASRPALYFQNGESQGQVCR